MLVVFWNMYVCFPTLKKTTICRYICGLHLHGLIVFVLFLIQINKKIYFINCKCIYKNFHLCINNTPLLTLTNSMARWLEELHIRIPLSKVLLFQNLNQTSNQLQFCHQMITFPDYTSNSYWGNAMDPTALAIAAPIPIVNFSFFFFICLGFKKGMETSH
jgi:hypothetical protein